METPLTETFLTTARSCCARPNTSDVPPGRNLLRARSISFASRFAVSEIRAIISSSLTPRVSMMRFFISTIASTSIASTVALKSALASAMYLSLTAFSRAAGISSIAAIAAASRVTPNQAERSGLIRAITASLSPPPITQASILSSSSAFFASTSSILD